MNTENRLNSEDHLKRLKEAYLEGKIDKLVFLAGLRSFEEMREEELDSDKE